MLAEFMSAMFMPGMELWPKAGMPIATKKMKTKVRTMGLLKPDS